ncbi:hypothetical protein K443DRAFT_626567 [Laccaria amethystina LaAM-08-1]|uniref:DUF6534 domain-containing protein n=1 Tax=Laccaria amethystina LaAM-08-1 TaxID=1095629 RepID=A0A0C9XMH5_9AGAR|nr:hypothetical protein K443DRAFT_626567 [Laccaria amethystina LaAM-08-1]
MFIGLMINILLFGIMIAQVYVYHTSYKKDSWGLKCFVSYLFIADLVNAIFCFVYLYRTLIINFGNLEVLGVADWSELQLCGILTAFEVGRTPDFVDFRNFKGVVATWLASTVVCDAFITFILRKRKTGFQRSDMMVDRIIRITVQTGLITMIIAVFDLAFYLAVPSGLHLLFSFPLSKLYTNSLMSSLNSRHKVFYGSTAQQASTMDAINTSGGLVPPSQRVHNSKQQDMISFGASAGPEVFVHVEHHELRDVPDQGIQESGNEEQSFRSSLDKGEGKWPTV